ncbi:SIR2 family protein [Thalassorhabdus alkalitolerans]|uniref:SIR2 family protein n=1 Tax=Thalassorhabdus alkalitolerans TaxID=2282697 RepID=A0ABW0YPL5_9BACI
MEANLHDLRKDFKEGKVVPFIGAGLSAPFQVPTWKSLIEAITEKYSKGQLSFLGESVNILLQRHDYWSAVDQLKSFANLDDQDIQTMTSQLIEERMCCELEDDSLHNYTDIAELNFDLYLTTNYEGLLYKYVKCSTYPMELRDINFSTQDLFDKQRVLHLHGNVSNPGSIVLSKSSYDALYQDQKYENLLKVVTSNKKLLFMGFSFEDQFIQKLIQDHREHFRGQHYIILDNPPPNKVADLKKQFGLNTIAYDSKKTSHVGEIRKILAHLSESNHGNQSEKKSIKGDNKISGTKSVVPGAKITDFDEKVEHLFYKKLKLENVEPALIELSSYFYVAAEIYIRELKNNGMPIDVINTLLGKVLIHFQERYIDTFRKHGNSQQFVEVVHETLENIELGRHAKHFTEDDMSDKNENRGLIHLLADDEKKKIWWGEKRLNE